MLHERTSVSYEEWKEGDIDPTMIGDTTLKGMLTYLDEDKNPVDVTGDFSIAFVIAEDQEEQEVHILWIIQRVPERAALAK